MSDEKGNPRLYISYSRHSPANESWVLRLATDLRESGVDVILDQWDLPEGQNKHAFMEEMVANPKVGKVVIVSDKDYVKKSGKKGGQTDRESQVIPGKAYEKADPKKIMAAVREKDPKGLPLLPGYYASKRHVDFSDEDRYAESFDQLLRWVYDEPLFIRPELGKKPSYFAERHAVSVGNPVLLRRALEALRTSRGLAEPALREYLENLVSRLEDFRIVEPDRDFDELLLNNIEQFIPTRNDVVQLFRYVALYASEKEPQRQAHRFFEGLAAYFEPPDDSRTRRDWDCDNFKFIAHELFLYAVAAFLRYERFGAAAHLLRARYYVKKKAGEGRNPLAGFGIFRNHLQSLDYRNERLRLGHQALHAELLRKRNLGTGIDFEEVMQADFVLYLRDSFDALRGEATQRWWPESLFYRTELEAPFEIFARAESREYFEAIKEMFDIERKDDFEPLFQAFRKRDLFVPQWEAAKVMPARLVAYDRLAMRP